MYLFHQTSRSKIDQEEKNGKRFSFSKIVLTFITKLGSVEKNLGNFLMDGRVGGTKRIIPHTKVFASIPVIIKQGLHLACEYWWHNVDSLNVVHSNKMVP